MTFSPPDPWLSKNALILEDAGWLWCGHRQWLLQFDRQTKGVIAVGNQAAAPPLRLRGGRFDPGNAFIDTPKQPEGPERTTHAH